MASAEGTYYFIMQPFREANVDLAEELYKPLLAKRGGNLADADRKGLLRLGEELGFDWFERYGIALV